MNKQIKNWLMFWLSAWLTMLVVWITYATISHVNSNDTLTAVTFNQVIDATVPSWAVMAFNLSTCPFWWKVADGTNGTQDLRDEFIRWAKPGAWREVWQTEDASAVVSHFSFSTWPTTMVDNSDWSYNKTSSYAFQSLWNDTSQTILMRKVRPQNVALLFCEKE